MPIHVIGAGLAGSEAAWQLAQRGHQVKLFEMRPDHSTPAHQTGLAAEMVCSNSFKSDIPESATGILKAEMARLDSLILNGAFSTKVPAGQSLAVDRLAFSEKITQAIKGHPNIEWVPTQIDALDLSHPTILATGPLTSEALAEWLARNITGRKNLAFFDAIAPIVEADSIDMSVAFKASRYGKGGADFINCPLDKGQYDTFIDALLAAPRVELHETDAGFFEACLPIEVMADRGRDTLRHGPMKPVGLDDPRTGRWPYAAVQLRQDTQAGDLFNLVGFQTRLKHNAQKDVFRLIPGLENALFARLGSIHRNTFILAPEIIDATLAVKHCGNLWLAGQLSGVEGYLESAASGLAAALFVDRHVRGLEKSPLPEHTMLGSLLHYLASAPAKHFTPTNAMLGLLPPLPAHLTDFRSLKRSGGAKALKTAKGALYRERALKALEDHLFCKAIP